jgi:hypothetical protein
VGRAVAFQAASFGRRSLKLPFDSLSLADQSPQARSLAIRIHASVMLFVNAEEPTELPTLLRARAKYEQNIVEPDRSVLVRDSDVAQSV